ncbi:DUF2267 domain-containing protein [Micromonospora krabiensis]|uniref:Uncharacterized conserved protein, DUF2267 family n=1 Tax=Micromonospora krabiensis TaxID=307121 RepID=A0A1C3N2V2_9ACTN|nr:DUF2267 domain-containing protein [Micromonospora krabiensis]SBV26891.1 Uncharacterized conserved protein, DUF2267 family [Micromonospora krabiensis]
MDNSEFIDSVAQRLRISPERATAITRATLTTLAERIESGEAKDLAAQLPEELSGYAYGPPGETGRFSFTSFLNQVGGRAELDGAQTRDGVRAVFDTLREALPPGAYDDIITQLPAEFWQLTDSAGRYDGPSPG